MVYLHTGPMGVYRACFFIARAGRAATPERNRSGNQPPILCILPLVAHQLASARNYFAFGQDVAPSHTGLVIGCLGGLGNLFAAGFMPVAGWISQGRSGFTPNFIIIGLLPLAGLAALLAFWRSGARGAFQLLFFSSANMGSLGRRVNAHPGRDRRCFASRWSSLKAAARTCRIASAPSGSFQNISVPFTR